MQELFHLSRSLPATAALEAFTKDSERFDSSKNEKKGSVAGSTMLDMSSMFRSVIASEDAAFDFPDIDWPYLDNDNETVQLDKNKNNDIGTDDSATLHNPLALSKGKKRSQEFDEYMHDHIPYENTISNTLRRSKTLRTELQSSMSNSRGELHRLGSLQKRYISEGHILGRFNNFDCETLTRTDFSKKPKKELQFDLLSNHQVTDIDLAPATAALSEFFASTRQLGNELKDETAFEYAFGEDSEFPDFSISKQLGNEERNDKLGCGVLYDDFALTDLIRDKNAIRNKHVNSAQVVTYDLGRRFSPKAKPLNYGETEKSARCA